MNGLMARLRAPFSGNTGNRRERAGNGAFAFAGSLVGLSSTSLGRGANVSARPARFLPLTAW